MFRYHCSILPSLTHLVRCFCRSRQTFSSSHFLTIEFLVRAKRVTNKSIFLFLYSRNRYKSPCNCINAEENAAYCQKKVITIICRFLVVPVLKTTTSRHNISTPLAPPSRQNGACSGLPRFIASALIASALNLGLGVLTSLSLGQYIKASRSVSDFPVMTSLSVNKYYIMTFLI